MTEVGFVTGTEFPDVCPPPSLIPVLLRHTENYGDPDNIDPALSLTSIMEAVLEWQTTGMPTRDEELAEAHRFVQWCAKFWEVQRTLPEHSIACVFVG